MLSPSDRSGMKTSTGDMVHKEAAKSFDDAIKSFVAHDKAFDWNEGTCKEVAGMFTKSSDVQQSATSPVSVLHPSSEEGDGATWVAICRSCKKSHLEAQSSSAKNSEHMAAQYLAGSPHFVCRAVIGVTVDPDDVVKIVARLKSKLRTECRIHGTWVSSCRCGESSLQKRQFKNEINGPRSAQFATKPLMEQVTTSSPRRSWRRRREGRAR